MCRFSAKIYILIQGNAPLPTLMGIMHQQDLRNDMRTCDFTIFYNSDKSDVNFVIKLLKHYANNAISLG